MRYSYWLLPGNEVNSGSNYPENSPGSSILESSIYISGVPVY